MKQNPENIIQTENKLVRMTRFATNVQLTDRQREKGRNKEEKEEKKRKKRKQLQMELQDADKDEESEPKDTSVYEKLKEGQDVVIDRKKYKVEKITTDKSGYQAILFWDPRNKEGIYSIGGSFPLTKPFADIIEWFQDWIVNNFIIGLGILPPQLETAIQDFDKYRDLYNIKEVTGYSLGAILAGLLARFERNKEVNFSLYNGGDPLKLGGALLKKYGSEINMGRSTNIRTFTAQNETLSNIISLNTGAGMYEAKQKNKKKSKHDLGNIDSGYGAVKDPIIYVPIVQQTGWGFADTLTTCVKPTENGGIEAGISFSPTLGNTKVKADDKKDTEPIKPVNIKPVNYIKQLPKKNTKNDKNIKTVSNEIKRLIPPNNSDYSRVAPYLIGKFLGVSPSDEIFSTTNDNKEEYDKYLTSVMKSALGHEQLFRGINAFEMDKLEGLPSYKEISLQKEIPPRIGSEDSVSSAITREILPYRENQDGYYDNEQMEDFLRNTLDDFIIRMGFDMHDYN